MIKTLADAPPPHPHHSYAPETPDATAKSDPKGQVPSNMAIVTDGNEPNGVTQSRIPTVCLDVDAISDAIAARLATSLVGHVLFLKNQVPFPVMQLARILGGKSNARASKKRDELLSSFDTLSSHLVTTFAALSTALARSVPQKIYSHENDGKRQSVKKGRSYLVLLVGASAASAKSKVVFAVDGLEIKIWGARNDITVPRPNRKENDEGNESRGDREENDTHNRSGSEDGNEEDDASDPESSDESSQSSSSSESQESQAQTHPTALVSTSYPSYAEEQQALHAADRLLSRTLATADGEGHSMACEMAPTQTHILIRAPRQFIHPSWVPRQNLSNSLDGVIREFLEESGMLEEEIVEDDERKRKQKKKKTGARVEGVWIRCREGNKDDGCHLSNDIPDKDEDDMIWWSWDGKLAGFSDW